VTTANNIVVQFDQFYRQTHAVCSERDQESLDKTRSILVGKDTKQISDCPCCSQRIHLHKRKVTIHLARSLVALVKVTRFVWIDGKVKTSVKRGPNGAVYVHWAAISSDIKRGGASVSLLHHFGLILPYDTKTLHKGARGFWAATDRGIAFADRKIRVPEAAYVFNNVCFGFTPEQISIDEVQGFNYTEEVMGGG
jgi:hypothetical protein